MSDDIEFQELRNTQADGSIVFEVRAIKTGTDGEKIVLDCATYTVPFSYRRKNEGAVLEEEDFIEDLKNTLRQRLAIG